jgi:hypothetical protein
MRIILISSILALLSTIPLHAQIKEKEPVKRIKVKEFRTYTGFTVSGGNSGSLDEFAKLAPQSELLLNKPEDLSLNSSWPLKMNGVFSVMMGMQFRNREKTGYKANPMLRLGLRFVSGSVMQSTYLNSTQFTYDTLVSSQSGQTIFVDSVFTTNYELNYRNTQLQFDGSLIFRTNPGNRVSIFSGFGLIAGASMNALTRIDYYRLSQSQYRNSNGNILNDYNNFSSSGLSVSERHKNQTNLALSAYVPLGIDFRLGNKGELLRQTYLFLELRPGVNFNNVPELETISTAYLQQALGIKISW